jgi:hypothetical protein
MILTFLSSLISILFFMLVVLSFPWQIRHNKMIRNQTTKKKKKKKKNREKKEKEKRNQEDGGFKITKRNYDYNNMCKMVVSQNRKYWRTLLIGTQYWVVT